MVARGGFASRGALAHLRYRAGHGAGASAARSLWRCHARGGRRRGAARRLRRRLRSDAHDGGDREDPAWLLRERRRRHAVRAPGRARPLAWSPRAARRARRRDVARGGSGKSVRRVAAVARAARRRRERSQPPGPTRTAGSHVVLVDGALGAWIARGGRQITTFLPADDPERARVAHAMAGALARLAGSAAQREVLLVEIDDVKAPEHPLAATCSPQASSPPTADCSIGRRGRQRAPPPRSDRDVPEGDTIYRAAATLARALVGRTVTRFETAYAQLARIDDDAPLAGRTIEAVWSEGKHLLMRFSGGHTLRTHMRMNGSWHIYRPGDAWQRPRRDLRILIETGPAPPDPATGATTDPKGFVAVAFSVPVAELLDERALARSPALRRLGPDLLAETSIPPSPARERAPARTGRSARSRSTRAWQRAPATSTAPRCCFSAGCRPHARRARLATASSRPCSRSRESSCAPTSHQQARPAGRKS